jgi:hypothetical protein
MTLSNLNPGQKKTARGIARHAALLGLRHAPELHYTQSSARWQGINERKLSEKGQYPTEADCSAFATWCLWNALAVKFHQGDIVNGEKWRAGYTGTMLDHGMPVRRLSDVRWADCVIYGVPGTTGEHTAIITHVEPGGRNLHVVSNGSEAGPFWLPYNYRSDIMCIRRYI